MIDLFDGENLQVDKSIDQEKPHFDFEEKELSSAHIESENSFTEMSGSHSSFMSDDERTINKNNELVLHDTIREAK